MPRIRIDRNSNGSSQQPFQGRGLRSNQGGVPEEITPNSEREREECFDMYRSDGRVRRIARDPPKPRKASAKNTDHKLQLWQIGCLISALGAFCMFVDCLRVDITGVPVRLLSYEILCGNGSLADSIPSCSLYISMVPLVFVALFAVFAYMKDDAFEKSYLALIAVLVFMIAILFYWGGQVNDFSQEYLLTFSPGHAMFIEIGCCILLAVIIICQKVLGKLSEPKPSAGWTR